jgi:hypothetical protein
MMASSRLSGSHETRSTAKRSEPILASAVFQ